MLDVSAGNLMMEVKSSESLRDQHLEAMDEQVRRYHGPHWRAGSANQDYYPENHAYEYISLVVPRIVLDNPRVRVSTRRPGSQDEVAEAMRHALNRWVRDTRLSRLLIRIAIDSMFNYGVLLLSQVPRPGKRNDDLSFWPQAYRIPQRMFFRDYLARHDSECRYMGHKWRRDKDDLLRRAREQPEEGWNAEALREVVTDNDNDTDRASRERGIEGNARGELTAYEVWVPEYELPDSPGRDEGFHGTIFTMAAQTKAQAKPESLAWSDDKYKAPERSAFIRAPRAYYGPRQGPYTTFGIYTVPDSAYPLSPLAAVQGQQDDLNRHVIAASNADERYKRLVFVDNTDPKLIQRVKDAGDSYVIPISGLESGKVVQVELGGSTPQQWEMIAQKRDRLDRNSGIFDAQRGSVAGRGTATEVAVADEASASRLGFIKHQFQDAVQKFLQGVAWYLFHDDRVDFPLGPEAAEALGLPEPWFKGGMLDEGSGATFDDLELEIEPYSMERTSEGLQQKRTMEVAQLLMSIGQAAPMMPFIDWKQVLEWVGDSHNFPELKDVLDPEVLAQVVGLQQSAFEEKPQPRMGKDSGAVGAYGQRSPAPAKQMGQLRPGTSVRPAAMNRGASQGQTAKNGRT